MIHIFKAGGAWSTEEGFSYDIKSIEPSDFASHKKDGWKMTLDELLPKKRRPARKLSAKAGE